MCSVTGIQTRNFGVEYLNHQAMPVRKKTDNSNPHKQVSRELSHTLEPLKILRRSEFGNHVTEKKPVQKKKPPLLRAKTLPAIITPSLNIIQAQLDANNTVTETSRSTSFSQQGSGRGTTTVQLKSKIPEENYNLMVTDEETISTYKSPSTSPVSSRYFLSSPSSSSSQPSGSKQKGEQSRTGLAKLARFLTSKERTSGTKTSDLSPSEVTCFAWNKGASSMRRANSIDSLLELSCGTQIIEVSEASDTASVISTWNTSNTTTTSDTLTVPNNKAIPLSPSVPSKLETHKKGNIPSSPSIPNRLAKGITGIRQGSVDVFLEGLALAKGEKKRTEKFNKFNIDLQGLFVAVEHEHVERARSILETTDVDVNSINGDGFSTLDIAVMTNCVPMVKLLQNYGGKESKRFPTKESRTSQLVSLVNEAERCEEDLSKYVNNTAASGSLSAALLKEKERQLTLWQRRLNLLKRMQDGFERITLFIRVTGPPDMPKHVQLTVVGTRALRIKITESDTAKDAYSIVTKYKVDWSRHEDFSLLAGSQDITDLQRLEVTIPDLTQGTAYFVRVAAGNAKGFSPFQTASPSFGVPSSWKDVEKKSTRGIGKLKELANLFHEVINSRPAHAAEVKGILEQPTDTPHQQRRQVKRTIKNLFTSAPKFQKVLRRGVFLACLFYNEDKVLVTTEETLPVVEVDETYPSSLHIDFHWLIKVACTWEDIKTLRQDMEKSQSSSVLHFRSKLLQAVEQMQVALGVQDLGQLYYKPIKDKESIVVLSSVKNVSDPKTLNSLSVRWLPLTKILRKLPGVVASDGRETPHVSELLLSSLQDMINYNRESTKSLPRGLYLGYVKLKSSVDVIRVLVPQKTPNVLPFSRIRENSHVSREEWEWLKSLKSSDTTIAPSTVQLKFQKAISSAAKNLFSSYDIPLVELGFHRLYDVDVIEMSPNVSFLLVLPPVENVCSIPGQYDDLTSRMDCIPLPIQVFEILHMTTYRYNFIVHYSRLSSILEMDTLMAQHALREAFSSSEVAAAKERLLQLQLFQTQVDNIWKGVRWIMDVLTFARDKLINGGIPLNQIYLYQMNSPSPQNSPRQSPMLHPTKSQYERRMSRDEVTPKYSLHITMSSSSFSIPETRETNMMEIRRSISASKLLRSSSDSEDLNVNHSELTILGPKANSSDSLGVSFNLGSNEDTKTSSTSNSPTLRLPSDDIFQCQSEDIILQEEDSNSKIRVKYLESTKRDNLRSLHQLFSLRGQKRQAKNNYFRKYNALSEDNACGVQEHSKRKLKLNLHGMEDQSLYTSMSDKSFSSSSGDSSTEENQF
ncbi:ankyrin repeat and fibronectin type-III domain-containing protein 1-like [Limulus polyphemus]|uniref:Ankyrin repeat and fibronectin type-III domain-containing protein 1-like n=1 Tax=Limulus polyphemus TaxID=6850 RepID=A0ABM1S1L8_LIMPO|nr:ankyrin repeat and fibronectin type-III domain-containing protein 1-like [Limulus polyphemus]